MRAKAQPFRAAALPAPMMDPAVLRSVSRLIGREATFQYKVRNKLWRLWRGLAERTVPGVHRQ
jgi:hypothetical protein